ncbi:hypothetical protein SLA2020_140680 [Shorea laevis]
MVNVAPKRWLSIQCSHPIQAFQDVVSGCCNPSIMDIKIGSRTWYPEASNEYIEKCLKKDRKSTSVSLGFRISGLQIFERNPDCSFAHSVYGGSAGILAQLLDLKAWFEYQTIYHFYSCSVLMFCEKEPLLEGRASVAGIKLIDFAHVVEGKGVIDHNFLGGLCSLIKFVSEILDSSDESAAKACDQSLQLGIQEDIISTDNGQNQ